MTTIADVAAAQQTATSTSNSASSAATKAVNENFDLFLSMLTTQLQNQDPLDPMDTSEMTSQLVSYTQVEQNIATNKNLEDLISLTKAQSSEQAVSYIGKQVEALNSTGKLSSGQNVNWKYSLASNATEVTLSVVDASGNTVYTKTTSGNAGTHDFAWDGTKSDGTKASDGTYFLTASAKDSSGNPINTDVRITGTVDAVDFTVNPAVLMVGNTPVTLTSLTSVSNPTTP